MKVAGLGAAAMADSTVEPLTPGPQEAEPQSEGDNYTPIPGRARVYLLAGLPGDDSVAEVRRAFRGCAVAGLHSLGADAGCGFSGGTRGRAIFGGPVPRAGVRAFPFP